MVSSSGTVWAMSMLRLPALIVSLPSLRAPKLP
jgi:hypothetical protein